MCVTHLYLRMQGVLLNYCSITIKYSFVTKYSINQTQVKQSPLSIYLQNLSHNTGADAVNISGLLVYESRLLNPKKLENFNNRML